MKFALPRGQFRRLVDVMATGSTTKTVAEQLPVWLHVEGDKLSASVRGHDAAADVLFPIEDSEPGTCCAYLGALRAISNSPGDDVQPVSVEVSDRLRWRSGTGAGTFSIIPSEPRFRPKPETPGHDDLDIPVTSIIGGINDLKWAIAAPGQPAKDISRVAILGQWEEHDELCTGVAVIGLEASGLVVVDRAESNAPPAAPVAVPPHLATAYKAMADPLARLVIEPKGVFLVGEEIVIRLPVIEVGENALVTVVKSLRTAKEMDLSGTWEELGVEDSTLLAQTAQWVDANFGTADKIVKPTVLIEAEETFVRVTFPEDTENPTEAEAHFDVPRSGGGPFRLMIPRGTLMNLVAMAEAFGGTVLVPVGTTNFGADPYAAPVLARQYEGTARMMVACGMQRRP